MNYNILIKEFARPKVKIDYIKLAIPPSIQDDLDLADRFVKELETHGGYIRAPKKYRGRQDDHFTIHDPSLRAIQFLINEYPGTAILKLEIAMDFMLKDGSNDFARLVDLHGWLKVCLFPQRYKRFEGGRRKFYDISDNRIKPDALKTKSGNETIYWQDASYLEQVRLYIKTVDNKKPVEKHSVRLEITLFQGACVRARVDRVWMIPEFAAGMRCYLSPFFNVAKGIKPQVKRNRCITPPKKKLADSMAEKERVRAERNWNRYGSAWAAEHGYKIIADADANRLIGAGLKSLQDKMKRLEMTRKVAECINYFD